MSLLLTAQKTVFLVVMACSGDPRDQNCGDSFNAESWIAATHEIAKEECERFLREDFDPKAYLYMDDDMYAAVRCE